MPLSLTIMQGLAADPGDPIQLARHPDPGQRVIGHQGQALPGEVIDDRQDAEAAAVGQGVGDEVQRPPLVRSLGHRHRRPGSERALAPAALADHQPFFAV